jgi:hypothetical protein
MPLIINTIIGIRNRLLRRIALSGADLREYPGNCSQIYPQGRWVKAFSFAGNGLEGNAKVGSTIVRQASDR